MRTALVERRLPYYTRGEEIFNMISHIIGAVLGIIALAVCVYISAAGNNMLGVISSLVYGVSMILLYTTSSIYHGLRREFAKKVFQVLDHCAIYLFIAGTYTPFALGLLIGNDDTAGWALLALEWGLAALAVTLTAIDLKKFRVFSMICYIFMGWGVVFFINNVIGLLYPYGFGLLVAGGIFYTVGAVLYGVGRKIKFMHCAFHVFVLIGSVFQFFAVILYAI